jgi:hypothetical protein
MIEDFIEARSASGRPLCFPVRRSRNTLLTPEGEGEGREEISQSHQMTTQLNQPAAHSRFSTAIYQILERVENKVKFYNKNHLLTYLHADCC